MKYRTAPGQLRVRYTQFVSAIEIIFVPFVYLAAWVMKFLRLAGVHRFPLNRKILYHVGVFPIINHYYEPQFDMRDNPASDSVARNLTGIDWNIQAQIELLEQLTFADELADIPLKSRDALQFHMDNPTFNSGDAEYWYQLIRLKKPKRIFEIGSGRSTLMAIKAIEKNREEEPSYDCKHICIEPYEMPWLEQTGIEIIREKAEDVALSHFQELGEGDILFVDCSHMIRPDGDVLFVYLELLPSLNTGVIVHLHDIFSPRNYKREWLHTKMWFWNEQYILEAFLSNNNQWKIIGAINHLHHNYHEKLKVVCPYLTPDRDPGSFYIQKIA